MDPRLLPFADYATRFRHLEITRDNGILLLRHHSDGGTLQWGGEPQTELGQAFRFIAADPDTKVVIMTGSGDAWNGPEARDGEAQYRRTADHWDIALWNGRQLEMALLDIEVPVIAAINGPVYRHVEIPLLSDLVIAADTATFDDRGHFPVNLVAGDGVFAVTSMLMGHNRARHFHLTGRRLDAREALEMGLVAEVLPSADVLPRAWELARMLAAKPTLALRYQRLIFVHPLKKRMLDLLGYSLALEGLAATSGGMPSGPGDRVSSVY